MKEDIFLNLKHFIILNILIIFHKIINTIFYYTMVDMAIRHLKVDVHYLNPNFPYKLVQNSETNIL